MIYRSRPLRLRAVRALALSALVVACESPLGLDGVPVALNGMDPPPQPSTLTSTATTAQVVLTWTDGTGETSYQLQRGLAPDANPPATWVLLPDQPADATTYIDTGVAAQTRYLYRIRACNASGCSAFRYLYVTANTTAPPPQPSTLTATATATQVALTWTDGADETSYQLQRGLAPDADPPATWVLLPDQPANATTYTDTGVSVGTRYLYRISACNAGGCSAFRYLYVTANNTPPPPQPSTLTATVTATQVVLSWTDGTDETSYQLQRGLAPDANPPVTWVLLPDQPANTATYTDTGVSAGTRYLYRIRACNAGGCSAFRYLYVTANAVTPPAQPSTLSATASATQVVLTWTDGAGETSYQLQRGLAPDADPPATWALLPDQPQNATTYTDTGVSADTRYLYRISACNPGGCSAFRYLYVTANGTPPPPQPSTLSATATATQVVLTWTDGAGETSYQLQRGLAPDANPPATWVLLPDQPANATTYTDPGVAADTRYLYRISACNAGGCSGFRYLYVTTAVLDTTAPTVTLTNPADDATVSGTISVDASASDGVGVVGVQFKVNGSNLGAEDTSAPYSVSWNTTLVADGIYTLSATARDAAGNLGTAPDISVLVSYAVNPGPSAYYPLSVAPDRRHLQDKVGNPFFVNGDTPWELIQNLTLEEADAYLTDRKNKGFNAILINLLEHFFSPSPPNNAYGQGPFTVPGDFATPNPAYFAHVDAVLQKAFEKDIVVFMVPIYLGYGGGQEGWYQEVNNNGAAKLYNFGRWVGNRYRFFPNIVWVMGGDFAPNAALAETRAFALGVDQTYGPTIFTTHNARFESGVTQYEAADTWIDLNSTYASCATAPQYLAADYARTWNGGPIPFFFIEGDYEPGLTGGACYRSQAYWSVLMGGVGHFFGNNPLWNLNMGSNWQQYLSSPVAQDMIHWKNLFATPATALLVPDVDHTVLTAGYSSAADFAAAARTSDGRAVIVYTPSQRALTIDMTKISGASAVAVWYNPDTGASTPIGTFPTSGSRSFTPPTSADWVLVLRDAAG